MDPIRYDIDVQTPFQAALAGYGAGQAIRNDQMQMQQQQAAQQQALQMRSDLAAVVGKKDAGSADYIALMTKYPQLSEQLKRPLDALNAAQQQSRLQHGTTAYAAMLSGRDDIAERSFRDRAAAARNAGAEDEAKQLDTMADMIKTHAPTARTSVALGVAAQMGPEKFAETFGKLEAEARARDLHPALVEKGVAEAKKTGSEAVTAEVAATNAPALTAAELAQRGATLGLTKAQTGQAIALTKKYNQDTQNAILEAATGDPAKRFDAETKLRGEYVAGTKDATATVDAYRKMTASDPNSVGDIALVYGFMKMLDPTSVVREGEFATAQNAAGVPERVMNLYNKALEGKNRLPDGQRAKILAQAKSLAGTAEEKRGKERERLAPVLRTYKLDEKNVFGEAPKETAPPPAPTPGSPKPIKTDADYNALPAGAQYVAPDGSTRTKR